MASESTASQAKDMAKDSSKDLGAWVDTVWRNDCIPRIAEYIATPNLSPFFVEDTDEARASAKEAQDTAMEQVRSWVAAQEVAGMSLEVLELPGRTPLLFIEVQASTGVSDTDVGTVLLYGHVDKQPPFTGWHEGLSPYTPVIRGDRLYGRGGADDGYSAFAAITAIRALQTHSLPHGRCVIIIEASEESGSPDLPFYMEHLASRIGAPNLVVCLDSGAGNYEQLWVTTSLRGIIVGKLAVSVTKEGVHSGDASGVVPGTFRVLRKVLDRLEDSDTGVVRLDALHVDIPAKVREQVGAAAKVLGRAGMVDCFPFLDGARPVQRGADEGEAAHLAELALNRWWRPQVAVVGADGLPPTASAGNVLRPSTTVSLSIRLPPTLPTAGVEEAIRAALCEDAPYGATCTFESGKLSMGCAAPPVAPWLEAAASEASMNHFGKDAMYMGEGGSIPFMGSLMTQFPQAQFLIIGVLGPASNAHGPNEFLEIGFSSKLTSCVAHVLTRHCDAKVEASLAVGSASAGNKAQKLSAEAQASNFGRNPDGTKI